MHRHDLVYLQPTEAFTLLNASVPLSVVQAVDDMIAAKQPFTVCRQTTSYISKVATSHIENHCKYRLALELSAPPKVVTSPLALEKLILSLPSTIQNQTQAFINQCCDLGTDVYAYGSFANQYFTDLPFVTPTSDLDILIVIHEMDRVSEILVAIESFKQLAMSEAGLRLDGEVRLHGYKDVSFNELIHALVSNISTVVVKTLCDVELQTMDVLLGWKPYERERFIDTRKRGLIF